MPGVEEGPAAGVDPAAGVALAVVVLVPPRSILRLTAAVDAGVIGGGRVAPGLAFGDAGVALPAAGPGELELDAWGPGVGVGAEPSVLTLT